VLDRLQQLGCLHLIDLSGDAERLPPAQDFRSQVHEAIKYLRSTPTPNPNQHTEYPEGMDCLKTAGQILENKRAREEYQEERDFLVRSIEQTEPWGDFRLPEKGLPNGLQVWFYRIPHRRLDDLLESHCVWQKINEDLQFQYIVVISDDEPVGLPTKPLELDPRPLSELQARLRWVDEQLEALWWERVSLDRWCNLLNRDLDVADDEAARMDALTRLVGDEHVFAIQGWAPLSTLKAIEEFGRAHELAIDVAKPVASDKPPTLLKNPTAIAGAEGAVTFYITPAYNAWDPTWIMYFSFAIFFAMIMSDAAYGVLMGLFLMVSWKKLGTTDKGRRFRSLMVALVVATIAYGVAIGSYFGVCPAVLKPFQLQLNGQPLFEQREAMMLASLAIGAAHLALSNLITAWRMRGSWVALSSVGWAVVLVGGLVYGLSLYGLTSTGPNQGITWLASQLSASPGAMQQLVSMSSLYAVVGGLSMVFLFASSRPLFSNRVVDWLLRMLDGLIALTNVSKAFGDTLSYLRLFALGLASAQLASTFNGLASGAMEVPGLGVFLAILILIAGHGINLLLGIIGGVVHGLRLNCIEFFNWSLNEEGYPFRAFSKKAG
jgi:V/A-type H+/Na+-transporting ATPase subunit I